ncbi:MAG: VWA domain-containing protein, partial [Deltaproteobacteria bacterium]|nr:VWA domain-containing protein [Deltaproteobacteria bacterium]
MSRKTSSISNLVRWKNLRWVSLAASIPAIWACSAHDLEAPKPLPEKQSEVLKEVNPIRDLDILFMIDDSGSMKQEQENLQKNFPKFIKILQDIKGGLPNVHIGVISSNVGAGNILIPGNSACSFPGGDRGQFKPPTDSGLEDGNKFIISNNNGTQDNIVGAGTIADTFTKMANLGVNGCGYEHQLQSIRLALYENVTPTNTKFLRPNAYLAIIMITDEDDCSGPPETNFYVDGAYP